MNTLPSLVPFILLACTGASQGFAGKPCASPEPASILEELIHQATTGEPSGGQKDPKAEIAKLRGEIAALRLELESALKEIKSLKDAIGQGAVPKDQGPLYRGKPARVWLDQVNDGDWKFRLEAVEALGSLAEKNKEMIPALVTALKDTKSHSVRVAASDALASLGAEVVPMLLVVLKDKTSPRAVEGAADAVRTIGPKAKAAVPLLSEALKMDDWGVRRSCVTALGQIGPDAKPAIPAMVDVLGVLLKNAVNDAKFDMFGRGGFPDAVAAALVNIDPELREILPNGILKRTKNTAFGGEGFGTNLIEQMTLFQQAHAALKKKYAKEK